MSQLPLDLGFLNDPNRWPRWPVCPVKRVGGGKFDCGLVVDTRPGIVYLTNLWDISSLKDLETVETLTYDGWQSMIDDGWGVD